MSSPPATLGQYQIIREIARSNDIVYEAYDPLMNRRVAVKELAIPAGMTDQQRIDRVARFKREAQAAGTLNHPNIMTVYSFAEDGERTFMALEFLDGGTLRSEVDNAGPLSKERAAEIAMAVLEGLSHAHAKGVIHRDIKPDNVQILSNGSIKITDFGIARLTFQPNLTMDGQVFGTPSYMSPEQIVGKEIDARSDLFSVGVMLYEMIAGVKPFTGDSVVSISYSIMNKAATQPPQADYAIWRVLERAMEKSPSARYNNAAEMIEALHQAIAPPLAPAAYDPFANNAIPSMQAPAPSTQIPSPTGIYANPYMPMQPGVAYTQPYDPYAQQQYQGQSPPVMNQQQQYFQQPYQPQPPTSMFPPSSLPQYYPPPPRQPLLKPEHISFLRQLGLWIVIIGTLLALVIVVVQSLGRLMERYSATQQDKQIAPIQVPDTRIPVQERIQTLEKYRSQLRSPERLAEAKRVLGALYGELGHDQLDAKQLAQAEVSYKKAIDLDPNNPAGLSNLADVYGRLAQFEPDVGQRAQLWRQSGVYWEKAAKEEPSGAKSDAYREQASAMFYQFAYEANAMNDLSLRPDVRDALYDAQRLAPPGSQLEARVREMLKTLQ
ncbi:serine/threonine protein kinase [bacterium]|nr:MAG: serine/threonine protein kinase [bacterium]